MAQSYLVVALALGLLIGFALGGRPRHLAAKSFRWWLLLPLGVVLQLLVELDGVPVPKTLLVVSYVYLLGFCLANLRHAGMGIVTIGIAMNAVVIAANGGMPVREEAIYQADVIERGEVAYIDEVKHHVEDDDTRLMFLGDIIPVRPLRQVLSFGDLVLSVGVADLLVHLLRPVRKRRRRKAARPSAEAQAPEPGHGAPGGGDETDAGDGDEQRFRAGVAGEPAAGDIGHGHERHDRHARDRGDAPDEVHREPLVAQGVPVGGREPAAEPGAHEGDRRRQA